MKALIELDLIVRTFILFAFVFNLFKKDLSLLIVSPITFLLILQGNIVVVIRVHINNLIYIVAGKNQKVVYFIPLRTILNLIPKVNISIFDLICILEPSQVDGSNYEAG